jgi:lipopolysaccharide/colanic/teichoic acid biosynthesis glycosyltransferase
MSFLHGRFRGLQSLYALASVVMIAGLYYATISLHPAVPLHSGMGWNYVVIYPILLIIGSLIFCLKNSLQEGAPFQNGRRIAQPSQFLLAARQTAYMGIALFIGLVLTKDIQISRLFLAGLFPVLWVGLILTHSLVYRLAAPRLFQGARSLRTLVIANVTSHDPLLDWLRAHNHLGLQLAGVLSPRLPDEYADLDASRFGAEPEEIISRLGPQVVICSDAHLSREELASIRVAAENAGSRFAIHLDRIAGFGGAASIYTDFGHALAVFRREPLESPLSRLLKRTFDLGVAIPIVVMFLPILMLLVGVIHRMQSPGPLFFRQQRRGVGGQVFLVYKFRTMHCDHHREGEQARAGDPRIFPAGHWMRKFSIDEFPQFLNVLTGEMSVVGPRPHYVDHDTDFAAVDPLYRFRKFLKPGVTGLAQVLGYRGITLTRADVRERSYADLEYLENWSLRLDFIILVKTAWQVIKPPKSAL